MTKQYLISEKELKELEAARLLLSELGDSLPSSVQFELSKVQGLLWRKVNRRREEGLPSVVSYHQ
ncbi:hypothetical protein VPH184E373B_0092 [Vibrio phage 184E37-3b]|nr:hypothetical protein MYOV056v2_p0078 [Vibrio phage 184E37.3a]QZI89976.1 hypothetical protein MYOV057v1_p0061 [Vibrio phage 184E37.1]